MAKKTKMVVEKDPFEGCPKEFRAKVEGGTEAEINSLIAETAKNQAALMEAKDQDQHLKECKNAAKEAGAIYKEGTKQNKMQIAYARSILAARGKPTGDDGLDKEETAVGVEKTVVSDDLMKAIQDIQSQGAAITVKLSGEPQK